MEIVLLPNFERILIVGVDTEDVKVLLNRFKEIRIMEHDCIMISSKDILRAGLRSLEEVTQPDINFLKLIKEELEESIAMLEMPKLAISRMSPRAHRERQRLQADQIKRKMRSIKNITWSRVR